MKKFIKKLIFFSLPIIMGLLLVEVLSRRIPNEYSAKKEYLDKNSNNIEVLYLGNSHIYFGLNPEVSQYKSYNASYISQSLDLDEMILEEYNEKLKKLKFIIISADYITLYNRLAKAKDKWRIKNYNLYYNLNVGLNPFYYTEIFQGKFKDQIERVDNFYIQKKQPKILSNVLGFGISYKFPTPLNIAETSIKAAERHTFDINKEDYKNDFEINKKALINIVDFAKKKNVKIIFLSTPVSKQYYKKTNNIQLKNTLNIYKKLTKEQSKICFYLNYLQDKRFGNDDLYDGDHLNNIGAEKLTNLVDLEIKRLK